MWFQEAVHISWNSRSISERMGYAHLAIEHINAVVNAQRDIDVRAFYESLEFIVFGVIVRIDIVLST